MAPVAFSKPHFAAGPHGGPGGVRVGSDDKLKRITVGLKLLGNVLILVGIVMIVLDIISLIMGYYEYTYFNSSASGVYTGLLAIAAGILAIIGAKIYQKHTFCRRYSLMAHVCVGVLLFFASISLLVMSIRYIIMAASDLNDDKIDTGANTVFILVANSILALIAAFTIIVAFLSVALACCGCMKTRHPILEAAY